MVLVNATVHNTSVCCCGQRKHKKNNNLLTIFFSYIPDAKSNKELIVPADQNLSLTPSVNPALLEAKFLRVLICQISALALTNQTASTSLLEQPVRNITSAKMVTERIIIVRLVCFSTMTILTVVSTRQHGDALTTMDKKTRRRQYNLTCH